LIQAWKNSLYVFLGACSFGILSTIVKTAYKEGFTLHQVMGGQYGFGWALMLVLMLLFSRRRVSFTQFIRLAGVGACTCLTGVLYYMSLQSLPASIAIVLLFQFTWIGVGIEAMVTRKWPSKTAIGSVMILFAGTVLAGGLLGGHDFHLSLDGVLYGLGSALTMSLFIFFSGRVETQLPLIARSFYITTGSFLVLITVFTPQAIFGISFGNGLWLYGLVLGAFGAVIPVLLFGLGAPKISPGLASILSAGEFPVAVMASVVVLHEQVTWPQWLGIVVILLGIAYPQLRGIKTPQVESKTIAVD
jgi:drug/metabolite transporter (DMT)-like permease